MANCSRYSIGTYVYGHTLLAVVTVEQTVNGLQVLVVITLDLYQYGQLWSLLYRYICLWTNSVSCGYCGVDSKWPTGPCCKYLGPVPDMANCGRYSVGYLCLFTYSVSCGSCAADCKWPTGLCCKYLGPVPDMANCGRYSIGAVPFAMKSRKRQKR